MSEKHNHNIETQLALLAQEMQTTRQEMRKYNDLRKTLNQVLERVIKLETQQQEEEKREKAEKGVVKSTREWLSWAIAFLALSITFIQFMLKF